jgi:hypothetical protein
MIMSPLNGRFVVSVVRFVPLLLLPLLSACTDLRASFEIKGSAHALSLIRVTGMPWEKTAKYSV